MKTIIVAGMSSGGSAAIGMGARLKGINGVLAVAPAPVLELVAPNSPLGKQFLARLSGKRLKFTKARFKGIWSQAQKTIDLIAAGKGDQPAVFSSQNIGGQGWYEFEIKTTPTFFSVMKTPKG